MIVDLGDKRFDAFTQGDQVACYQFWSRKRAVVYFRDEVVLLKQMPADPDPEATHAMQMFCDELSGRG